MADFNPPKEFIPNTSSDAEMVRVGVSAYSDPFRTLIGSNSEHPDTTVRKLGESFEEAAKQSKPLIMVVPEPTEIPAHIGKINSTANEMRQQGGRGKGPIVAIDTSGAHMFELDFPKPSATSPVRRHVGGFTAVELDELATRYRDDIDPGTQNVIRILGIQPNKLYVEYGAGGELDRIYS